HEVAEQTRGHTPQQVFPARVDQGQPQPVPIEVSPVRAPGKVVNDQSQYDRSCTQTQPSSRALFHGRGLLTPFKLAKYRKQRFKSRRESSPVESQESKVEGQPLPSAFDFRLSTGPFGTMPATFLGRL